MIILLIGIVLLYISALYFEALGRQITNEVNKEYGEKR